MITLALALVDVSTPGKSVLFKSRFLKVTLRERVGTLPISSLIARKQPKHGLHVPLSSDSLHFTTRILPLDSSSFLKFAIMLVADLVACNI